MILPSSSSSAGPVQGPPAQASTWIFHHSKDFKQRLSFSKHMHNFDFETTVSSRGLLSLTVMSRICWHVPVCPSRPTLDRQLCPRPPSSQRLAKLSPGAMLLV